MRKLLMSAGALALIVGASIALHRTSSAVPAPAARSRLAATSTEEVGARSTSDPAEGKDREEARRARNAMRDRILEALRTRAAAAGSAAKPSAAPSRQEASPSPSATEEIPIGAYDPDYIRSHFREDMFPLLKSCYEGALKRRPALAGKLALKFTIVGDPQVGGVVDTAEFADESDLKDSEMETCVRESLMTLTFDKQPSGSGKVDVVYPVLFSPGDPEEK